ncbi:DUF4166 domain-containing protein [Bacillus lacus]|uniref:DUF4166 domain-containing protein n=1 Tax=Metabacillus lacus TaxID=1983721 RepID=A0A7X2J1V6_9BACI|nr:DUF4166 domain-containing protein [Metabacillus lacus]MRX73796.1 DUF4166 domain-containing protein [Metabacillus lacus]
MTIYEKVLGEKFNQLHPQLQKRYRISLETPFEAAGVMKKIENGAFWTKPLLSFFVKRNFLFPESGAGIPFSISNTYRKLPSGEEEILWKRTFDFSGTKRYFHARMTADSYGQYVRDYLGEPELFYSELHFDVSEDGSLQISSGKQRILIRGMEISLPAVLEGKVIVKEGYNELSDAFTISVDISSIIAGRLMKYEGEFKAYSF